MLYSQHLKHVYWIQYRVIAVSGEQSRKDFLTSSALNFRAGYTTLHGSVSNACEYGCPWSDISSPAGSKRRGCWP